MLCGFTGIAQQTIKNCTAEAPAQGYTRLRREIDAQLTGLVPNWSQLAEILEKREAVPALVAAIEVADAGRQERRGPRDATDD